MIHAIGSGHDVWICPCGRHEWRDECSTCRRKRAEGEDHPNSEGIALPDWIVPALLKGVGD